MLTNVLNKTSRHYSSKWPILFLDVCIVLFTFFLISLIQNSFNTEFELSRLLTQLPLVALFATVSFALVGSHKVVPRYKGYNAILSIVISVNILALMLLLTTFVSKNYDVIPNLNISGLVAFIHLLLNSFALLGFRFLLQSMYKTTMVNEANENPLITSLIYGAGGSGMLTSNILAEDSKINHKIIGFINDNSKKNNTEINRFNIYNFEQITPEFVNTHNIDQVIIALQDIEPMELLNISTKLFDCNLKVKIVPPIHKWVDGNLSYNQIKTVAIEDVVGRKQIEIKNPILEEEYENEIILITGAAGSVGSEIARKLATFQYKHLVLLDIAESPLYDLQQEFKHLGIRNVKAIIGDVRDKDRMDKIFDEIKPKIVFHAAAYKHVPLMENNPYEAVRVNVLGTKILANNAVKYGIKKFVLISTDKAVNPTNVMGATKRIAELYVRCLKGKGKTKFITTRFGNVLGSNGSVIPLFKSQIEKGGPLTVTHRDITRYFMTISEACQLVLEAAAMGNGGEIFVFDMGKSVKIFDLAKQMIGLSGLRYPEDIGIKITGLRPGEKISEELLGDGENAKHTNYDKIMIVKSKPFNSKNIEQNINVLCAVTPNTQILETVSLIKAILPEYISNNSKFEVLDTDKK
ncbi:MAG: polysaccharide biosynthesis protein [Flavobacteriaceae bacterium]|nr:polysaccharide biosynthesis protein [Flavobacteriaceae bacterium]